jgi:hypothetical protein
MVVAMAVEQARTKREKATYNSRKGCLTQKQLLFVRAYARCQNATQAAIMAGVPVKSAQSMGSQWLNPDQFPLIRPALEREMAHLEATSILKAEQVRRYIHTVLQFCPGDYFKPGGRGGWLISEEAYDQLPREIRMLVEDMQLRTKTVKLANGTEVEERLLLVRFVSKNLAMTLAAKYALVEKHPSAVQIVQTNWHDLAGDGWDLVDPVEEEIATIQGAKSVQPQMGLKEPPASPSTNGDAYS